MYVLQSSPLGSRTISSASVNTIHFGSIHRRGGHVLYEREFIMLIAVGRFHRADDKTAAEYGLEGGATLHLVLALRGGY